MMLFLGEAIAIMGVALMVFCIPWQDKGAVDRDTLNRFFYQFRLRELERETGVHDELVVELQRNLLEDIPLQSNQAFPPLSSWWLLPGALGLVILSTGIFILTSDVRQVMNLQQAERQFPVLYQRVKNADTKPLSMSEMSLLKLGLSAHLQSDPDFLAGWQMLGRLGLVLNDGVTATGAFERAYQLSPQDNTIAFTYASVLIRVGDREQIRQGELLAKDMLNSQPANPELLELQALSAWRQENYERAVELWLQVLKKLPSGSPLRKSIQLNVDEAQRRATSIAK